VPFSAYQLQLRSFYAMADTRTPTLINLGVSATLVVVDLVLFVVLPDDLKVVGLAAGHATSFLAGLLLCSSVLSRRVVGGGGVRGGGGLAGHTRAGGRCGTGVSRVGAHDASMGGTGGGAGGVAGRWADATHTHLLDRLGGEWGG
jgi:putative peptidoglycan lipid II flippase